MFEFTLTVLQQVSLRMFVGMRVGIISGCQMVVRIVARVLGTGVTVAVYRYPGSAVGGSVGMSIDSKGSCASGFTEAMVCLDASLHISSTAP